MKKAFTLIEMVIVVMIISILLWFLSFLSWSYISKLNVQNEKETLEWDFFYLQSMSLSQPKFWKIKNVKYVWVRLTSSGDYIQNIAFSGNDFSKFYTLDLKPFYYTYLWTWFYIYSGNNLEETISNDIYILYKPYSMGALLVKKESWWTFKIFTWNRTIKFIVNSIYNDKNCYKINLESWRLYSIYCNF